MIFKTYLSILYFDNIKKKELVAKCKVKSTLRNFGSIVAFLGRKKTRKIVVVLVVIMVLPQSPVVQLIMHNRL